MPTCELYNDLLALPHIYHPGKSFFCVEPTVDRDDTRELSAIIISRRCQGNHENGIQKSCENVREITQNHGLTVGKKQRDIEKMKMKGF